MVRVPRTVRAVSDDAWRCRSGEGERQKAGAQQHQAGCGEGQETVGDQIVIAHDTPATLDARPN